MKSTHWLCSVSIYFNRSIIDLGHRLQLNIITPDSIIPLPFNILLEVFFSSYNELDKEFFLALYVVHAILPNEVVVRLIPVVNLIRYSPEEAVPVSLHVLDHPTFDGYDPLELVLLLFEESVSFYDLVLLLFRKMCNLHL
jgi:hypothetical protein